MTDEKPAEKKPRSKRIYVLWGVALALLLTLGLFCWLVVVPYAEARAVVKEYAPRYYVFGYVDGRGRKRAVAKYGGSPGRTISQQPRRQPQPLAPSDYEDAVRRLGGPRRARASLGLYLFVEHRDIREFLVMVEILGRCGEIAIPDLVKLSHHEHEPVRQAAGEALKKIKAKQEKKP